MTGVVVNDTSVLIDLIKLGLLEVFAHSKFELWIPDFVHNEIIDQKDEFEKYIKHFNVYEFTSEEVFELYVKHANNPELSLVDISVLHVAEKKEMVLCTSDNALRKKAQYFGVDVHGLLWILEELLKQGVLKKKEVVKQAKRYLKLNSWISGDMVMEFVKRIEDY
ncbi:MAG: hypothetical protein ACOX0R_00045 [Candidatus Dojkabacteria bacterium]|jgi:predicted nucleic acid-binding protein